MAERMRTLVARTHMDKVAACSRKLEEAKRDRDQAIIDASQSGETYRDIAHVAHLSPSRVAQIVTAWRRES